MRWSRKRDNLGFRTPTKTDTCSSLSTQTKETRASLRAATFPTYSYTAPILNVPVLRFSWCLCGHGDFPVQYVKVKTWTRPVVARQARALTYAIGDFDRKEHIFGHIEHEPATQQVRLVFGDEWYVQQTMTALVELSKTHSAIWMDQLSIPQNAASIALNPQNMPQIYDTFDVVILLPDAPCTCLKEVVDSYDTGHTPLADETGPR